MTFETFTYTTQTHFFLMSSLWLLKLLIIPPLAVNWKKPLQLTCQSKLDSFFSRTVIPYLQCNCMISDLKRCFPSLPLNDRGCVVGEGVFFLLIYWSWPKCLLKFFREIWSLDWYADIVNLAGLNSASPSCSSDQVLPKTCLYISSSLRQPWSLNCHKSPFPDYLNKVTPKEPKWRGWSRETGAQEPRVRHKLLLSRRCKSWDGVCAKFPPTSPSPSCRQTPGGATTPRGGNVLRNFLPVIKKPS